MRTKSINSFWSGYGGLGIVGSCCSFFLLDMHWSLGTDGLRGTNHGEPSLSSIKPIAFKDFKSRGACGDATCRSLSVGSKPVRVVVSWVMTNLRFSGCWKEMMLKNWVGI